jgi:hypothetical protein
MVPLGDASRYPARVPPVNALIIFVNVSVFVLVLMRGETFVMQWPAVPAQIVSGHHWITILTAMFMHGSRSHITGKHGARTVHDLYFEPKHEEFKPWTIGILSQCVFTSAFRELDPIPQFKATAKLGEFLEARFSKSF